MIQPHKTSEEAICHRKTVLSSQNSHSVCISSNITSIESQGSIAEPTLFSVFITDSDTGTEQTLSKLADDTKLGRVADTPNGFAAI